MFEIGALSANPEKHRIFGGDPYFRDVIDDLEQVYVGRLERLFTRMVPVIFRPDALVTGQYRRIWSMLRHQGLNAVYAVPFRYDRLLIRECWRYQLNVATRQRIDVMDLMLTELPAAYILFSDERELNAEPLCCVVSRQKGPSNPERRTSEHLRYSTDVAQASVLTFLHVPDEPIDFVRELGAFFDRLARLRIVRAASKPSANSQALDLLERMAATYEHHDLTPSRSWKNLIDSAPPASRNELKKLESRWNSDRGSWQTILRRVRALHRAAYRWDIVSIAAASATSHFADGVPLIPDAV